jgi:acetyl esterase/lipase
MNVRRWGLWGLSLAVLIALAGCGGSDDSPPLRLEKEPKLPKVSWGEPDDPADRKEPRGLLMLLHGGGWLPNFELYRDQLVLADMFQEDDFATVAVGYGEGAEGFSQIEDVYAEAKERYPGVPICAIGQSAGGHLALMLATREPDLACVVDMAGPTNLTSLDPEEDKKGFGYAEDAFGRDAFEEFSPVLYADQIKARVLMILAENDPLIPIEQGYELEEALPGAELIVLPPGPGPFIHSGVDLEAAGEANLAQEELLDEVMPER